MLCINVSLFKKLCVVATCMKEGVSCYHDEANILRFVAGVCHCVAGVLLAKCFSSTDPGFSIEGTGYRYGSATGVSNASGAEGNGVVPGELVAWTGWLARVESMDGGWGTTGDK